MTDWAQLNASVTEVSSKFVKFGDAFKTLKRSYAAFGIDTSNIPNIPGEVRSVLESNLVLEPSQASLDKFLPQIGNSVAELMQMLKDKQVDVNTIEAARKSGSLLASSSVSSFRTPNSSTKLSVPNLIPEHNKLDTPSKDLISKLQNNSNLMRRASKRFSAYQTSSIISMQSPSLNGDENQNKDTFSSIPSITAQEIENAKKSSNMFDIDSSMTIQEENESATTNNENENENFDNTVIQYNHSKGVTNLMNRTKPNSKLIEDKTNETGKKVEQEEETSVLNKTAETLSGSYIKKKESVQDVIYLQLKDEVKKVQIQLPTTVANLKILFTQKFNYSPPGITAFPKIYIQESPASIRYELEDISELKYGDIISLKQPDIQTAIFQHVENQIDNVKNDIMNMENRILKKIENIQSLQPASTINVASSFKNSDDLEFEKNMKKKIEKNNNQQKFIDELEDEINRIKIHQGRSIKRVTDILSQTVTSVEKLNETGVATNSMSENSYVNACKQKVSGGCESLVDKLDDLQDVIEFMKRDITKHTIRPSNKKLDHISKEMNKTKADLEKLVDFTRIEKKNIASMWNKQMATIASDQKFFRAQEEIIGLLEQDYQAAQETFELIKSIAKQLENSISLNRSKLPLPDPSISPLDASKLVMAEVDAINPNHEQRVEAIEKAERVREMEKELKFKDEFEEELGDFVSNEKFKHTGGIDEIEKMRQEKDEEFRNNQFGVV